MQSFKYRIRRCNGNRKAWLLCYLLADGSESDVSGTYWTALSIDHLLIRAAAYIGPQELIEFQWSIY